MNSLINEEKNKDVANFEMKNNNPGLLFQAFKEEKHFEGCFLRNRSNKQITHCLIEEALKEKEQFLQATLDSLPASVAILDGNGIILDVNSEWRNFAASNESNYDFVGENYLEVCDKSAGEGSEDAAVVAEGIRSIISGNRNFFFHEYPCHAPNLTRWFVLRAIRFAWEGPLRILVYHENITKQKLTQLELTEKNNELEDFAYMVSHDLKTPIRIIRGYLSLINENPSLFEKNFDRIMKQTDILIKMVDRLLNLSSAGKVIGEKQELNLNTMLTNVFSMIKPEDVPAELKFTSALFPVSGDKERIEQVFKNLIENAFQHRSSEAEKLIIEVSSRIKGGFVYVCLKDNGAGIAKEHINKIFSPGQTMKKNNGTGFGLSIANKIITAHGGKIWVESDGVNKGSAFHIKLPV